MPFYYASLLIFQRLKVLYNGLKTFQVQNPGLIQKKLVTFFYTTPQLQNNNMQQGTLTRESRVLILLSKTATIMPNTGLVTANSPNLF